MAASGPSCILTQYNCTITCVVNYSDESDIKWSWTGGASWSYEPLNNVRTRWDGDGKLDLIIDSLCLMSFLVPKHFKRFREGLQSLSWNVDKDT